MSVPKYTGGSSSIFMEVIHSFPYNSIRSSLVEFTENISMEQNDMFFPPINRAMRALDRSAFTRTVLLSAAQITDVKLLSRVRRELQTSKDALRQERISSVQSIPSTESRAQGQKCILLRPEIKHDGTYPLTNMYNSWLI